jgi:hypothetical protein
MFAHWRHIILMVVLFYDGKIVAQLVALFNLLLKWYLAFCFCCILRDVIQNVWMLISFCSCFVCSCAAQVSCCYFSSTYGLVTFGTYISNSSSTFYTFHKFQISFRMNNSYDQRYISIDCYYWKKSQIISMHLKRIPKN